MIFQSEEHEQCLQEARIKFENNLKKELLNKYFGDAWSFVEIRKENQ